MWSLLLHGVLSRKEWVCGSLFDSRRCFSPVSIVQCWDLPLPCCCYKCDWRAAPYFVCQWQPLWAMGEQWDMWTRGQLPRPSEPTESTCSTLMCRFPGDLSGLLSENNAQFHLKEEYLPSKTQQEARVQRLGKKKAYGFLYACMLL